MQDKREKWMQLAEQAAEEQDPEKFTQLIHELDRLLEEKQNRLNRAHLPSKPSE